MILSIILDEFIYQNIKLLIKSRKESSLKIRNNPFITFCVLMKILSWNNLDSFQNILNIVKFQQIFNLIFDKMIKLILMWLKTMHIKFLNYSVKNLVLIFSIFHCRHRKNMINLPDSFKKVFKNHFLHRMFLSHCKF